MVFLINTAWILGGVVLLVFVIRATEWAVFLGSTVLGGWIGTQALHGSILGTALGLVTGVVAGGFLAALVHAARGLPDAAKTWPARYREELRKAPLPTVAGTLAILGAIGYLLSVVPAGLIGRSALAECTATGPAEGQKRCKWGVVGLQLREKDGSVKVVGF